MEYLSENLLLHIRKRIDNGTPTSFKELLNHLQNRITSDSTTCTSNTLANEKNILFNQCASIYKFCISNRMSPKNDFYSLIKSMDKDVLTTFPNVGCIPIESELSGKYVDRELKKYFRNHSKLNRPRYFLLVDGSFICQPNRKKALYLHSFKMFIDMKNTYTKISYALMEYNTAIIVNAYS